MPIKIEMGPPRLGNQPAAAKNALLHKPGALVTIAAITPGVNGAIAVVQWENPDVDEKAAAPLPRLRDMQLTALRLLPTGEMNSRKELDVPAARSLIAELVGEGSEETPTIVFLKDSVSGAAFLGVEEAVEKAEENHKRMEQAVEGLNPTLLATIPNASITRSMGINNKAAKTSKVLNVASAAFPQAADRLSTVKRDAPLAFPLLMIAHVLGGKAVEAAAGEEEAEEGQEEEKQQPKRKKAKTSSAKPPKTPAKRPASARVSSPAQRDQPAGNILPVPVGGFPSSAAADAATASAIAAMFAGTPAAWPGQGEGNE